MFSRSSFKENSTRLLACGSKLHAQEQWRKWKTYQGYVSVCLGFRNLVENENENGRLRSEVDAMLRRQEKDLYKPLEIATMDAPSIDEIEGSKKKLLRVLLNQRFHKISSKVLTIERRQAYIGFGVY